MAGSNTSCHKHAMPSPWLLAQQHKMGHEEYRAQVACCAVLMQCQQGCRASSTLGAACLEKIK
jgi:hypothetical protein